MVLKPNKEFVQRKIHGTYTPENQGKEEAYARLDAGDDPEVVLKEFRVLASDLVAEENQREEKRLARASRPKQVASKLELMHI